MTSNDNAGSRYNSGLQRLRTGNLRGAISPLNDAISADPNFTCAITVRAVVYSRMGDKRLAGADFNRVIQIQPNAAYAYFERGVFDAQTGHLDAAITDYGKALRLRPDYSEALGGRGSAYGQKARYQLAIGDLTRQISLDPNNAQAYYNRGVAHSDSSDHKAAILDYDMAIRLNPKYTEALQSRCWERGVLGQELDRAIADCKSALTLIPGDAQALDSRAFVELRMKRFSDAIRDYRAALRANPESASSHFGLGVALKVAGDRKAGGREMKAGRSIDSGIGDKFKSYGLN
jgi:tetratricopeptide (TPR) repeat protein